MFEGIGAVSAGASSRLLIDYPHPYRSQILDYLFKPRFGAALQHLKVEIGSDVNSTDGSEPSFARTRAEMAHPAFNRGYEWWLLEEAKERNPGIILDSLPWGAPGWIGNGHFHSQDLPNYVAKFIKGAKSAHNLNMEYTGVWNERLFEPSYVVLLGKTLLKNNLFTHIDCCDLTQAERQWTTVTKNMAKSLEFRNAVSVIGVHAPNVMKGATVAEAALKSGKPLWASEDEFSFYTRGLSRAWSPYAESLAMLYNLNYILDRITTTEIWSPVTSYYDALAFPGSGLMLANTPWSGHYQVLPMIWVTAQTTQFAQPGWHYINSACGYLHGQGTYVTLKSQSGKNYSVIIETINAKGPQRADFRLAGGLLHSTVHVWETNATKSFLHVADLQPHNNSFSVALDPDSVYSLSTTTGQHKGTASPPPSAAFPFPYNEDFESTQVGQSPRYFADQDGSFEVHACTGRPGRCLEQVIARVPIPWGPLPDPYTLLGSTDWKNYTVSVDAMLEGSGDVPLLGQIDEASVAKGPPWTTAKSKWPSGYVLLVHGGGRWELMSTEYQTPAMTLASGKIPFRRQKWHRLQLSFQGSSIEAVVDRTVLAHLTDSSHSRGMVGVGTGWNSAQFDDFAVR
ncbi:MAG: galactosylceramidase [Terriglobia bacterium]